jgi:predicted enzyme related to lactoylglutathione lyase
MLVPEDQFVDMSEICAPKPAEDGKAKKPLWSVVNTFAVEDMDETLEKVVQSGGKIFQ